MKLYQIILNFHSDSIHTVIAENEHEAVNVFVEYLNCLHQSYTASDFSASVIDLKSVQYPIVIH